ncbi:hypothetical protein [Bacillus paralicheniformis]|uniref:hypothetical protein n=1 Tax=Bacillus paralicheniformis TaxID=1648923 RepID=UPI00186B883F|nr:hypothetical protein [Bacillus paralicheniformis]
MGSAFFNKLGAPRFVLKKSHLFYLIAFIEMRELGKIGLASIDESFIDIFKQMPFV